MEVILTTYKSWDDPPSSQPKPIMKIESPKCAGQEFHKLQSILGGFHVSGQILATSQGSRFPPVPPNGGEL